MIKFRTVFDEEQKSHIKTNPGSGIKREYQLRIKDKAETLEVIGTSNLYESIQSHADSVDIHKILERCAMIDDYSILNKMPAQFMDVTEMPHSLAEAHAMIVDAQNMFDRMPIEIKEKYDNNFVEFISSLGTKKFDAIAGEYLDSLKSKEVKPNEVKVEEKVEK